MLCYKMSLRCDKGVKDQVHKDLPIGLKIYGNDPYNLLEMLNIFLLINSMSLKGHKEVKGQIFKMFQLSWNL